VVLNAGQGVTITGSGLPRITGIGEGLIFPPSLTINAGGGGITLDRTLSLFPSPEGTLNLTTTGGGNLAGSDHSIVISDSQSASWQNIESFTVGDSHVNAALHLNDPNPVLINISGSVSDFSLFSPKPVEMYVTGNLIDSSATIENLRPTDTTLISVGGEILDHANYVIVTLPAGETPDFTSLDQVSAPYLVGPFNFIIPNPNLIPALASVSTLFNYDPTTGNIRYEGVMPAAVEAALLSMKIPFLDAATIQTIYTQSQNESTQADGAYQVAGPGIFRINAASMDLGNGGGILSLGIASDPGLAPYTARGANIDISVAGNLTMLGSAVESEYGGDINITSGGMMDIGSPLVPSTSAGQVLGIISLWSGNISVIANGDINVDGSRIAAYDGGNIFVESLHGNVNAGVGGTGSALIRKPYVDAEGNVDSIEDAIPGSGILATSFPELVYGESSSQIGNITVETPQGNIVASQGGIVQLALGPVAHNNATINLNAGSKNSDGSVAYVGNVDASGSGVVGGQVNITATGNINGLVVASVSANVSALQNVSATVLSQGAAIVSAGGTASGVVVGVGSVSVSGGTADVMQAFAGGGVTTSGNVSGPAGPAAPVGSNSGSTAATTQTATTSIQPNSDLASNDNTDDNDPLKKKQKSQLMQYVGRVTVLLPQ
jgi:hypothetical protein